MKSRLAIHWAHEGEVLNGVTYTVRQGKLARSNGCKSALVQNRKTPQDLTTHRCINLRLPTHGGLYAWEFEKGKRELRVRVEGQLVFNGTAPMLDAALAGTGLAYMPEDAVQSHLADGRLVRVLADWCPPYPGYHLYYPSRRQPTPAFTRLVDALRSD